MARIGMNGAIIDARTLCRIPKRIPPSVHRRQGRHNMHERQDSHLTQPESCPVSWVHLSPDKRDRVGNPGQSPGSLHLFVSASLPRQGLKDGFGGASPDVRSPGFQVLVAARRPYL